MKKIFLSILLLSITFSFTSCQTLAVFQPKATSKVEDISTLFVEQKNEATGQNEIIIPEMTSCYPVRLYITKGLINPYKLNLEVTYDGDVWVYTNKVRFYSKKKNQAFGLGKCNITTNKDGSVKEVYTVSLSDTQASDLYYLLLEGRIKVRCEGKHINTDKVKINNVDLLINTIKYYIMISNGSLKD